MHDQYATYKDTEVKKPRPKTAGAVDNVSHLFRLKIPRQYILKTAFSPSSEAIHQCIFSPSRARDHVFLSTKT